MQTDGTVRAWGWNGVGQLGNGTGPDRHTPVPVAGLTDVRQLAAGAWYHAAALRSDGTVWTWGWNPFGELGTPGPTGETAIGPVPVKVPALNGATSVAGGGYHSLATMADGTARAWGWNYFGQLGDGTTVNRHGPVRSGLESAQAPRGAWPTPWATALRAT